jgi:glycosyltransferase involved in cell wall biosynthesis
VKSPLLSFVIPCLNEARTLGLVIADCQAGGDALNAPYEIIVADNGSTDGSPEIAISHGAKVVAVSQRGYGAALLEGIRAAQGAYVLMGDADSTYDFSQAPVFVSKLQQGYDLVMGNRFKGTIADGAMPFLHRYLGNPVLSALGRLFFGIKISDFHCGLRGFDRETMNTLNLHCTGMEFASEMVIKSSLFSLRITEIPTVLRPNPPGRQPHLKTWRDGWRHLKFMLSFSPKYSLLPVAFLLVVAAICLSLLYAVQRVPFTGANTMIFAASCAIASMSILSDYILTREMLYQRLTLPRRHVSTLIDQLLGLNKGTDRLFKLSAASFVLAVIGLVCMMIFWLRSSLAIPLAATTGFLSCFLMFVSVSSYLTAAKVSTYRSLHYRSNS